MPIKREGERERQRGRWRTAPTACDSATQVTKLTNWPIWPILLWFYFWQTASRSPSTPNLEASLEAASQFSGKFVVPHSPVRRTFHSCFAARFLFWNLSCDCNVQTGNMCVGGMGQNNCKFEVEVTVVVLLLLLCCNCKWQPFFSVVAPCNTSHALVLFLSRIESRVSRSASSAKSH